MLERGSKSYLAAWVVVLPGVCGRLRGLLRLRGVGLSVGLVFGAVASSSCRVWSSGLVVCFRLPGLFLSVFQKEATTQGTDPKTGFSDLGGRRPEDRSFNRYHLFTLRNWEVLLMVRGYV